MDVEHDRSTIEDPSAERLPEATPHACGDGKQKHSDRDLREGNLSLDCSRFARQESCCQQRSEPPHTQLHANQDWTLAEADRKRRKKRGLRAVRGKVTPAPGGCNQKGATG